MARVKNNILEAGSGSVGPLVVYSMFGKSYMRSKPGGYHDKKSPAQLAQRQKLQLVNDFLTPFKGLLKLTFAEEAVGRAAYHGAKSFNLKHGVKGAFPDFSINKQTALLSKGGVSLPEEVSVALTSEGLLFNWDSSVVGDQRALTDTLIVMARISGTISVDFLFTGVRRSKGVFLWDTPLVETSGQLDVWIAFRNSEETAVSNSRFVEVR